MHWYNDEFCSYCFEKQKILIESSSHCLIHILAICIYLSKTSLRSDIFQSNNILIMLIIGIIGIIWQFVTIINLAIFLVYCLVMFLTRNQMFSRCRVKDISKIFLNTKDTKVGQLVFNLKV